MSPTVLRQDGFRFFFFSNEGAEPPHVHVARGEGHAKVWLSPVELAHYRGFSFQELRKALILVERYRTELQEAWNEHRRRR